jgi:hypothetical protein
MKKKILIAIFMVLLSMALFSCGGAGGVSGSDSGDSNIIITSASVTSTTNHDVDVVADTLTREGAVIAIGAIKQNPSTTPFPATVSKCRITYSPRDTGAPSIEPMTIFPGCTLIEGDNACSVTLIDIARKVQFADDITKFKFRNVPVPTHYLAEYDCDFENDGGAGSFPADYDIWLADFGDVPPLAVFPTSTTIAVGATTTEPFVISGGIQPYFVASDNTTIATVTFTPPDNFTVTGVAAGSATVTVTDSSSTPQTFAVTVTVQ